MLHRPGVEEADVLTAAVPGTQQTPSHVRARCGWGKLLARRGVTECFSAEPVGCVGL